ncbi:4Fe-4S dicluster domain-containing protein [Desulfosporosinus sp. FKB]|uniref:4Fe-4S dicluster domain-containing protein n=1 Tax=Desulfosporosinus sp. FKB TaxID=1969835 RepID=UPI000B4A3202|nr:4Fe-4S dicluster domain-containing protein [Desulfosporosinus sp. FKB]
MTRKMVFVDTSKCTGCKACTVACKEWNELPAEKTQLVTSYQSQKDFSPKTWTYVTFTEKYEEQTMNFLMRKAQCFHCGDPACLKACSSKAITQTESGFVVIDHTKCIGCGYCSENCPFGVPKVDQTLQKSFKCNGCIDRVENNLKPSCVQTCQTGALMFGDYSDVLGQAKNRLSEVQKTHSKAQLYGEKEMGGTTYLYLLMDRPEIYGLPVNPTIPLSLTLWKDVVRPVGGIAVGGAAAAVVIGVFANIVKGSYRSRDD